MANGYELSGQGVPAGLPCGGAVDACPFSRARRRRFLRGVALVVTVVVAVAVLLPASWFTFNQVRGQGETWSSLIAAGRAKRMGEALEEGDYAAAVRLLRPWDSAAQARMEQALREAEELGLALDYYGGGEIFYTNGYVTEGMMMMGHHEDDMFYGLLLTCTYKGGQMRLQGMEVSVSGPHPMEVPSSKTLTHREDWPACVDAFYTALA